MCLESNKRRENSLDNEAYSLILRYLTDRSFSFWGHTVQMVPISKFAVSPSDIPLPLQRTNIIGAERRHLLKLMLKAAFFCM